MRYLKRSPNLKRRTMNCKLRKESAVRLVVIGILISAIALTVKPPLASAQSATFQQLEKLELTLLPPTYNTDRKDGYGFEMRGNLYPGNTPFACDLVQDTNRAGRYLLRVRQNKTDGLIATWVITLNDGRQIIWDSYSKYELDESGNLLSFAYEAVILRSDQRVLTDYTPQSLNCFGGKLVLYFLNGG